MLTVQLVLLQKPVSFNLISNPAPGINGPKPAGNEEQPIRTDRPVPEPRSLPGTVVKFSSSGPWAQPPSVRARLKFRLKIDVGDECLRRNVLVTTVGCWRQIEDVGDRFHT